MLFTQAEIDRMPVDRLMWVLRIITGQNVQANPRLWNMVVDAIERKSSNKVTCQLVPNNRHEDDTKEVRLT